MCIRDSSGGYFEHSGGCFKYFGGYFEHSGGYSEHSGRYLARILWLWGKALRSNNYAIHSTGSLFIPQQITALKFTLLWEEGPDRARYSRTEASRRDVYLGKFAYLGKVANREFNCAKAAGRTARPKPRA